MSPQTQRVYRLPSRKSYNDLSVSKESIPTPSNHEVLIRVRSVSLNFRDLVISNSQYPFAVKDNVVPCSDVAGDIVDAGSSTTFSKGDRVISTFDISNLYGTQRDWEHGLGGPVDGVLREYVTIPAASVVKLPKESTLSYAQWACLPCTGVTAWNALFGNVPLKPGQTVLFMGTGGVSITGLILAKAAGATTIITSSSESKLKFVKETYGADHCINYKSSANWADEALKLTDGRGVDHILENGGSGTISQSIACCARGGIISVIGFLAQAKQEDMPDVASLVLERACVVRGVNVGSTEMLEDVVRFVASKMLAMPVEKIFGFEREEVVKAYEYLSKGEHVGKICIEVA